MSDINNEYNDLLESADKITNELTKENIKDINKVMEENAENNEDIKIVQNLPSNNNVEESNSTEKGEYKKANIVIDPNTGENKILSIVNEDDESIDDTSFEQLVADVESGKINVELDDSPITKDEAKDVVGNIIDEDKYNISDSSLSAIIEIANRKMNNENFNIYKALPPQVQDMINESLGFTNTKITTNESRALRNSIAESLINDFIMNISVNRAKEDLSKEIESIFKETATDIAEYSVGYTEERNKAYREYIETLEDEDKKEKLTKTLDTIDSAYTLEPLKEFAKTCKLKKYDIEEPKNYFRNFMTKYQHSTYNIYDIKLTLPILERKLVDNEKYNNADVVAFLVCFCKYIKNFNVENVLEHSFMYYVIYNIVMVDVNTSENTVEVSNKFIDNIKEVIDNIKERNSFLK